MNYAPSDPLLDAERACAETGLSKPAFYRAVRDGRLPAPLYPAPRAPRWRLSELRTAVDATRARPAEAQEARRQAKLAMAS